MRRRLIILALILVVVAAPTNQAAIFNGLPWTSASELLAVGILVAILGFSTLRSALKVELEKLSATKSNWIALSLVLLLLAKSLSYFVYPTTGQFEVCYRSAFGNESAACKPTFEPYPYLANRSDLFDKRSTNVSEINFGPREDSVRGLSGSSWRLPFVNTDEYNVGYWPWNDNDRNIEVLPFRAEFRGSLLGGENHSLIIRYVGEGSLTIDGKTVELPPSYQVEQEVRSPLRSSSADFLIDFGFLRSQSNGEELELPYATLRVFSTPSPLDSPARPIQPPASKVLNLITDVSTLMSVLLALFLVRRRCKDFVWSLIGAAAMLGLDWVAGKSQMHKLFPLEAVVLGLISLLVVILQTKASVLRALGALVAVSWIFVRDELLAFTGVAPRLSEVVIRLRGNDHLVYESLSQEMLTSGFLRGGESVYYFQPGIRYYFHILSISFGDSAALTGLVSVALMGVGMSFFVSGLRTRDSRFLSIMRYLALASLIVWWSSSHTTQSTILGLSEFYTWTALFVLSGLTLRMSCNAHLVIIAVIAASAVYVRPNQGIAMLVLALVSAASFSGSTWSTTKRLAISFVSYLGVLLLIPIHNLVYGGTLTFEPRGAVVARQLTWDQLRSGFSDQQTQAFLEENLRAIMYLPTFLPDIYSSRLALAFVGFWALIVLMLTRRWESLRVGKAAVLGKVLWLGVVGAQVLPFVKFTVVRYHPIQIIAIHLTALVVALQLSFRSKTEPTSASHKSTA